MAVVSQARSAMTKQGVVTVAKAKKSVRSKQKSMAVTTTKAESRAAKEVFFVNAYLSNGCNGAQAYRDAGFRAKNANVAAVEACKMLRKDSVVELIEARRAEDLAASKATADEVLQSATRVLRFDPRKLYRPDGSLKPMHELDADTADALAGVEVVEMAGGMEINLPSGGDDGEGGSEGGVRHVPMYTKKVKWLDKNTARDQLMKHHGLYEVDNRQKAPRTVSIGQLTVGGMDFSKVRARARLIEQV